MSTEHPDQHTPTHRRLPLTLLIAIGALAVVTLGVLVAVLFGSLTTYGGEIFVTIIYFSVFVGTLIGALAIANRAPSFPLTLALVADVFIIVFGAVLVWVDASPGYSWDDYSSSRWESNSLAAFVLLIPLWLTVIAPVFLAWGAARLSRRNPTLAWLSLSTTSLVAALAFLSFVPTVVEESFGASTPDWYWRVVAAIWVVAIALVAVYALLFWFYRRDRASAPARPARAGVVAPQQYPPVSPPAARAEPVASTGAPLPWPFAEDGVTPLAAGEDGLPIFAQLRTFDGRASAVQAGDPEAAAAIERGRIAAERFRAQS